MLRPARARAAAVIREFIRIPTHLRQGSNVFETYWTSNRGVEAMDNSYRLLDLTAYGRQETWEDSPAGWPQQCLKAGYSDDLGRGTR